MLGATPNIYNQNNYLLKKMGVAKKVPGFISRIFLTENKNWCQTPIIRILLAGWKGYRTLFFLWKKYGTLLHAL